MSPARHTIWLATAGTGTAFGILKSARERWGDQVTIVAADLLPRHLVAASAVADAFEQVPRIDSPNFTPRLLEGLRRHGADTYVPILDKELLLAAELRESGELPAEVALLAPSVESARLCLDKLVMAQWLSDRGLPTPRTTSAADAEWRPGGLFLKPRTGIGSVGARLVEEESELEKARGTDLIAQERCRAPEITLDVFHSAAHSFTRVACRERVEVKAGISTKARIFEDATLAGLAERLREGLGLVGSFCFQVMRGPAGDDWVITDVNARPGAGTRLSVAVGADFLGAALAEAWGLDPRPMLAPLEGERFVARQYTEYVLA